jgi:GT2 family glycosyltransferase
MSGRGQLDLSIVLVNFKLGKQLGDCLQSLGALQNELACEFILVDNSPPEAFRPVADAGIPGVRVIPNFQNPGYAAACNLGARASSGRYVWFLNPDVRYLQGSARALIEWLDRNSSVALVGPKILNPDGTRQFSCRSFPDWTTAFAHRHSLLTKIFPANPFTTNYLQKNLDGKPTEVDWASGCCLLVRRKVFDEVGGFDDGYFLFFEDADLAHRVKQRGWQCVYYPWLTFSHAIGSSRSYLPDLGIRAKHLSAERYFTKNVIRNSSLAKVFKFAISLRCLVSEQYHRHRARAVAASGE